MTTTIRARLRAAIFSGAVGLLPSVALAEGGSNPNGTGTRAGVPDHAAAEARGASEMGNSSTEAPAIVPDHAMAEARSATDTPPSGNETIVPDHAAAERRGASAD